MLLITACALLSALPGHAAGVPLLHREDRLHREIENLETTWRLGVINNNVATANLLLADDYLGINPNGTLETKGDALAQRRAGTTKISSLDPVSTKVRVYGETAVVTSVVDVIGQEGGRSISGRYHYTRVYSRRGGDWKIVSFEASRTNGSGKH